MKKIVVCSLSLFAVLSPVLEARAQVTSQSLASVSSEGQVANDESGRGNGTASLMAISPHGDTIVFSSRATNFGVTDSNSAYDVFEKSLSTGQVTLISSKVGFPSTAASGASGLTVDKCAAVAMSDDGSVVAYTSNASDLVAIDGNNGADIFVYKQSIAINSQVTRSGNSIINPNYTCVALSSDGSTVAFSGNGDLDTADTNNVDDVYVRNTANTFELISKTSSGTVGNSRSYAPSISSDGRFVAFASLATNFLAPDANGTHSDVFVKDRQSGALLTVSLSSKSGQTGQQGSGDSDQPKIAGGGKFVAFVSESPELVDGDTNSAKDVFVRDLDGNVTTRVSLADDGSQSPAGGDGPISISSDGRFVSFRSTSQLVGAPATANGNYQVYVRDRQQNRTFLISESVDGSVAGDASSLSSDLSADGAYVLFECSATNITSPAGLGNSQLFLAKPDVSASGGGGGGGGGSGGGSGGGGPIQLLPHLKIDPPGVSSVPTSTPDGRTRTVIEIVLPEFAFDPGKMTGKAALAALRGWLAALAATKRQGVSIIYEVQISNAKGKSVLKKSIKKNVLTLHNLRPGDYSVSYNVRAVRGNKVLARSQQSPASRFTVIKS